MLGKLWLCVNIWKKIRDKGMNEIAYENCND